VRRLAARSLEACGVGERGQQLRLGDEQLDEKVTARAETHETLQKLGPVGEQLDVPRARPGRGQEAFELVERLVGIRALPEGIEQNRKHPLEGHAQRAGIGHEGTTLDDEPEVLAGALGIGESSGLERHQTRRTQGTPGGGNRSLVEELPERGVHVRRDLSMTGPELARRRAGRARDPQPPGQPAQLERDRGEGVYLELVQDLQAVLDGPQMHERVGQHASALGSQVSSLGQPEDRLEAVAFTEPRIVAPVQELERLNQELDLADATPAQLDVLAVARS
jgi:hypothetical protein